MIRRTLGDVRKAISRISQLKSNPSSDIIAERVNEAQERLMDKGKWPGLKARYTFCVYDNCITLPRELDALLGFVVDDEPRRVNSQWFQFLEGGPGTENVGWRDAIDFGNVVTFRDICESKYIRVYCDAPEDVNSTILIRGYDIYGNRVQTWHNRELIDGEYVSLYNCHPNVTTKQFAQIDFVQKSQTNGAVRLYAYDGDVNQSCIAVYATNETLPVYRRYKVPALEERLTNDAGVTLKPHTITVLAKKRFIPAKLDTDELMIPNLGAIKNMVIALEKEENNTPTEAEIYENRALRCLNENLKEYQGSSRQGAYIQIQGFSGGALPKIR